MPKDSTRAASLQDEIERRHDVVGLLRDDAAMRGSLQDGPLKSCPDLDTLKTKMQRKKAALLEVTEIYLPFHPFRPFPPPSRYCLCP